MGSERRVKVCFTCSARKLMTSELMPRRIAEGYPLSRQILSIEKKTAVLLWF